VQIIVGARDRVIPPSNATFLRERLPHSKLDILDAGHFVWEEQSETYASLVTSWWAGGAADA
jgi:pimeloyl-ACP methyl ester carboxylesterase